MEDGLKSSKAETECSLTAKMVEPLKLVDQNKVMEPM
jgi:hypothetical protein